MPDPATNPARSSGPSSGPPPGPPPGPPLDPHVFRRYDVRGKVASDEAPDAPIRPALAYHVGRAVGTRIARAGGSSAAVGHDVRHSSPALADAAVAGLADAGIRVSHLGTAPTPVVYHAQIELGLDGCIAITGSHNPKSDNGLKIVIGDLPIFGDDVASLRTQIEAEDYASAAGGAGSRPADAGIERVDWTPRYADDVVARFPAMRRPPKVAIDTGNGVMGPLATAVLERVGCEVVGLYTEPDGDFPNHLPDPEVPKYMEALAAAVRDEGAACGLGFDGDGDRLGVLDERGRKISADWLIVLFARDLLERYPGGRIRYDVKCSDFLERDIRAHGGVPDMGETGHSLLKRDVKRTDAILGGELSGHVVFNRGYLPIDDSLYCALAFLQLLDRAGGPASGLFAGFPELVSTHEIKVPCADERKFDVVAELVESFRAESDRFRVVTVDGARVSLPSGAWFLVRASNTTPNLTVRLEAATRTELEELRELVDERLAGFGLGPLDLG